MNNIQKQTYALDLLKSFGSELRGASKEQLAPLFSPEDHGLYSVSIHRVSKISKCLNHISEKFYISKAEIPDDEVAQAEELDYQFHSNGTVLIGANNGMYIFNLY